MVLLLEITGEYDYNRLNGWFLSPKPHRHGGMNPCFWSARLLWAVLFYVLELTTLIKYETIK
jgi:hypothetical protein